MFDDCCCDCWALFSSCSISLRSFRPPRVVIDDDVDSWMDLLDDVVLAVGQKRWCCAARLGDRCRDGKTGAESFSFFLRFWCSSIFRFQFFPCISMSPFGEARTVVALSIFNSMFHAHVFRSYITSSALRSRSMIIICLLEEVLNNCLYSLIDKGCLGIGGQQSWCRCLRISKL